MKNTPQPSMTSNVTNSTNNMANVIPLPKITRQQKRMMYFHIMKHIRSYIKDIGSGIINPADHDAIVQFCEEYVRCRIDYPEVRDYIFHNEVQTNKSMIGMLISMIENMSDSVYFTQGIPVIKLLPDMLDLESQFTSRVLAALHSTFWKDLGIFRPVNSKSYSILTTYLAPPNKKRTHNLICRMNGRNAATLNSYFSTPSNYPRFQGSEYALWVDECRLLTDAVISGDDIASGVTKAERVRSENLANIVRTASLRFYTDATVLPVVLMASLNMNNPFIILKAPILSDYYGFKGKSFHKIQTNIDYLERIGKKYNWTRGGHNDSIVQKVLANLPEYSIDLWVIDQDTQLQEDLFNAYSNDIEKRGRGRLLYNRLGGKKGNFQLWDSLGNKVDLATEPFMVNGFKNDPDFANELSEVTIREILSFIGHEKKRFPKGCIILSKKMASMGISFKSTDHKTHITGLWYNPCSYNDKGKLTYPAVDNAYQHIRLCGRYPGLQDPLRLYIPDAVYNQISEYVDSMGRFLQAYDGKVIDPAAPTFVSFKTKIGSLAGGAAGQYLKKFFKTASIPTKVADVVAYYDTDDMGVARVNAVQDYGALNIEEITELSGYDGLPGCVPAKNTLTDRAIAYQGWRDSAASPWLDLKMRVQGKSPTSAGSYANKKGSNQPQKKYDIHVYSDRGGWSSEWDMTINPRHIGNVPQTSFGEHWIYARDDGNRVIVIKNHEGDIDYTGKYSLVHHPKKGILLYGPCTVQDLYNAVNNPVTNTVVREK